MNSIVLSPTTDEQAARMNHCVCCTKPIAPQYLMCPRHWRMVPDALQKKVNHMWHGMSGCAIPSRRALFAREYQIARRQAIEAVQAQLPPNPEKTPEPTT